MDKLVRPWEPPTYAMCFDPVTATVLMVAGTAMSAFGSIQQGKAQNAMAKYNAEVAERDAEAARRSAAFEEDRHRDAGERFRSTQQARLAAAGVDTGSGSPLALAEETAEDLELDALAIRYGGTIGAQRHESDAALSRLKGKAALQAGYMQAASTIMTSASKFNFGGGTTVPSSGVPSSFQGVGGAPY